MAEYTFPNIPNQFKVGDKIKFEYTGDVQIVDLTKVPLGVIKIECYGGSASDKGGYSYGTLSVRSMPDDIKKLYVVVGQCGNVRNDNSTNNKYGKVTFGGGGDSGNWNSGGGASDVRTWYDSNATDLVCNYTVNGETLQYRSNKIDKGTLSLKSLQSRLIVAGGSGCDDSTGKRRGHGNPGGGFGGFNVGGHFWSGQQGGQNGPFTMVYSPGHRGGPFVYGCFGVGGSSDNASNGASGGGWFGGTASDSSGGGSSYVSGNPECPIMTSSGIKLYDSGTQTGVRDGHGLIIFTVIKIGHLKSNKYLCYKKYGKQTVRIPLYFKDDNVVSPYMSSKIHDINQQTVAISEKEKDENSKCEQMIYSALNIKRKGQDVVKIPQKFTVKT